MSRKRDFHWNYRVMRHRDKLPKKFAAIEGKTHEVWFGIHAFYYGLEGGDAWSTEPEAVTGQSVSELRSILKRMLAALDKEAVDYDKKPRRKSR